MKILLRNRQRLVKIDQQKIKSDSRKILKLLGLKDTELSILLVDDKKMKELNSEYRGKNRTTDVLSFPQNPPLPPHPPLTKGRQGGVKGGRGGITSLDLVLGDIVINLQAAKRQAPEHRLSFRDELLWLLIHGILHLIGYDHERSRYAERKMRKKEKELLEYILRKDWN